MLACTAGLIGMASPWMALTLPTLGWRFLADKEAYWQWRFWHYNAVLIPIALGALLDVRLPAASAPNPQVLGRTTRRTGRVRRRVERGLAGRPRMGPPGGRRRRVVPLVTGVLTASDLPLWP